jgi:hypothetical protein
MAESTTDVRRDIELTRERMSSTLAQLERKLNVEQVIRDNPWPALGLAVGAGFLLSGSKADVKAAGATMLATRGASSKVGTALDDIMSRLMHEVTQAFNGHVDNLLDQVRGAIGSPQGAGNGAGAARGFGDVSGAGAGMGSGGMHAGTTPDVGQGGAANPWSTGLGDQSRESAGGSTSGLTPSSAGSQTMGGSMGGGMR